MGSLSVTIGSDPVAPGWYDSSYFTETHFSFGAINTLSAGQASAVAASSTIIGGADALSTDDTTSYAEMDQSTWATYPGETRYMGITVWARQDNAAALPDSVTALTSATLTIVARSTSMAADIQFFMGYDAFDEAGTNYGTGNATRDRHTAWTRYEANLTSFATVAQWRDLLAARAFRAGFETAPPPPSVTPVDGHTLVSFMGLTLTWAGGIAPPLRQHPRRDGLATSSARALHPASRSYQRSNRRAGGYL